MWDGPLSHPRASNVAHKYTNVNFNCFLRRCSRVRPVNMAEQHFTRIPTLGLPSVYHQGHGGHFEGTLQQQAAAVQLPHWQLPEILFWRG